MSKLGINIDHVATLRQARREFDPDPVAAAGICEKAGADSIVCHLREDYRHIQERDVYTLRKTIKTRMNLEMSLAPKIIATALAIKPDQVTIVPERRQELTTEGGLDVVNNFKKIQTAVKKFSTKNIEVSLFIAPEERQIRKSFESGATIIELHTGHYAELRTAKVIKQELEKLRRMTDLAIALGLIVAAGHGLKYDNARAVASIPGIEELNIGHSIVSRAVFVGLERAVQEMVALVHC